MIALIARYKLLLEIVLIGALASGVMWGVHEFLEHERDIGRKEVTALWDARKKADKDAADKLEASWKARYEDAINQGAENAKIARAAAATANASADRLRSTSADIAKLIPTASAETARAYASAYQTVFHQCVGEYRSMGESAQGHFNDWQTIDRAWPSNNLPNALATP